MSGTNKLVQSMIEGKKGSESSLISALQNANEVAVKGSVPKKEEKKSKKPKK